jgi:hypothetical protein
METRQRKTWGYVKAQPHGCDIHAEPLRRCRHLEQVDQKALQNLVGGKRSPYSYVQKACTMIDTTSHVIQLRYMTFSA